MHLERERTYIYEKIALRPCDKNNGNVKARSDCVRNRPSETFERGRPEGLKTDSKT